MGAQLLNDQLGLCELVSTTSWGEIRLSLPWDARSGADGLIQQLAHWCQQPLSFAAARDVCLVARDTIHGVVADVRLAPPGTQLVLPMALLKAVPPPLPLQGAAISWQPLTFQVTVSALDESSVEPAQGQENGMVLLPEAFQAPWMVQLQSSDQSLALWGHLHLNAGLIDLLQSVDTDAASRRRAQLSEGAWLVQLARPLVLDLPVAMGWIKGARAVPVDYSCDPGLQSEFGLSALLRHAQGGEQLNGMVVPVMLGAALSVRVAHPEM